MKNTRQKITLTPNDNALDGKIFAETEHAHILCDTSTGAFTVTLPDAQMTMQRELIIKNIGSTNNLYVVSRAGQFIDAVRTETVTPLGVLSVWPDLVKTWWIV